MVASLVRFDNGSVAGFPLFFGELKGHHILLDVMSMEAYAHQIWGLPTKIMINAVRT